MAKKNQTITISSRELKYILMYARENAEKTAERQAAGYIAYNPDDKVNRMRDLDIEKCGINNLYYKLQAEIERLERMC